MYDALTGASRSRARTGRGARHPFGLPQSSAAGRGTSLGLPRALRVRVREEHEGLVTHETSTGALACRACVLQRHDRAARQRRRRALRHRGAQDRGGGVALSFFCYPRTGPGRSFLPRSSCSPGRRLARLAVRCPACQRTSVTSSRTSTSTPFHNDPKVGVVEHVFNEDLAAHWRNPRRALLRLVRHPRLAL